MHLELTTRCNAACPQCPRNLQGGAENPAPGKQGLKDCLVLGWEWGMGYRDYYKGPLENDHRDPS